MVGGVFVYKQAIDYDTEKRRVLSEHVLIVRSMINVDRIASLRGDETDEINPDYLRLKYQLTEVGSVIENTRYVYIMAKKNGKTVLMVDTQPKKYGLEGLAYPGEIYEEFDQNVDDLLSTAGVRTTKAYTDKWGTFISGLASITNKDGKVIAMVGIDIETKLWQRGIWQSLVPGILILILVIMVEIIVNSWRKRNLENASRLAYLASVLESTDDAVYSVDFNNKILIWNNGAEKLYGFSALEAVGKNATEMIVPSEKVAELSANLDLISKGRHLNHFETTRKNKKGELMTVLLTMSPVYNSDNVVDSISMIARDITRQKLKDEEMLKHNMALEKMNQLMIDRELAMMELKKKIKKHEMEHK